MFKDYSIFVVGIKYLRQLGAQIKERAFARMRKRSFWHRS